MATMATKVKSIEHLKQILSARDGETHEFYIQLNFGLRSRKLISWDGDSTFYVLNETDDTEQELTEAQLMDRTYTNVGHALNRGALYLEN